MLCQHYLISGRVQGVWYRASAGKAAKRLGLTGWVRNLSDGRVELMVCGTEEELKQLTDWLWKGPPLAKVKDIEITPQTSQTFADFSVRRGEA